MLTKEISEVEKGCGETNSYKCGERLKICGKSFLCPVCEAKLSTLKSAQAKFDKFLEDLRIGIDKTLEEGIKRNSVLPHDWAMDRINEVIDELSSKQEVEK